MKAIDGSVPFVPFFHPPPPPPHFYVLFEQTNIVVKELS